MANVSDSDLAEALALIDMALGSEFRSGGLLDRYEEDTGADLIETGAAIGRLAKAAGMADGGWSAEDIHWK